MARIVKDHIDKWFDYGVDVDSRTIYLGSVQYGVDDEPTGTDFMMAEKFIKGIYLLEMAAPNGDKPINVIMNNPGGDVFQGMAIYDAIVNCKNHVSITVYGECCSMATIILQAADEDGRILAPHSTLMMHEGSDGHNTNHPSIIKKWQKYNEKFGKKMDGILLTKIREKNPEFKEKKFKELNMFDTILFPEEAVKLGLADRILDLPHAD